MPAPPGRVKSMCQRTAVPAMARHSDTSGGRKSSVGCRRRDLFQSACRSVRHPQPPAPPGPEPSSKSHDDARMAVGIGAIRIAEYLRNVFVSATSLPHRVFSSANQGTTQGGRRFKFNHGQGSARWSSLARAGILTPPARAGSRTPLLWSGGYRWWRRTGSWWHRI
jgi:hypothetical protein